MFCRNDELRTPRNGHTEEDGNAATKQRFTETNISTHERTDRIMQTRRAQSKVHITEQREKLKTGNLEFPYANQVMEWPSEENHKNQISRCHTCDKGPSPQEYHRAGHKTIVLARVKKIFNCATKGGRGGHRTKPTQMAMEQVGYDPLEDTERQSLHS